MNYLKEPSPKTCDFEKPIITKSIFWDTFGCPITSKYRTIEVNQDTNAMKVTGIPIENVSGFKELTNVNSFNMSNDFHHGANSASNSNTISDKPERNPNKDTRMITNTLKATGIPIENVSGFKELTSVNSFNMGNGFQHHANSGSNSNTISEKPERNLNKDTQIITNAIEQQETPQLGQGSLSEPTLALAKDRGDSVGISEDCREENANFQNIDSRNSSISTRNRNLDGCIFIKNAENIYKSVIKFKKLQKNEKNAFKNNFPGFGKMLSGSKSKNLLDKNAPGKDNLEFENGDMGDFDIAIYLTGSMVADTKFQRQTMDFESKEKSEYKAQRDKIMIKKKQSDGFEKSNQIMKQSYTNRPKQQRDKQRTKSRNTQRKSQLTYVMNKPSIPLNFSADESDTEYEWDESGAIITKRKAKEVSDTSYSNTVKLSNSGSTHVSYTSRKSGSKPKFVSQSSLSRYSDVYGVPKSKITEEEMWEAFEMIFKTYSSTNRHSGEVIARRISTEWMKNAGVVDEILTQKEADDAFRSVAGTKITMNPQEYKNFLINLSLKMRLSYYELYRRMCGM